MTSTEESAIQELKEDQSKKVPSSTSSTTSTTSIGSPVSAESTSFPLDPPVHPMSIERQNLFHVLNVVMKELIDSAVNYRANSSGSSHGRRISETDPRLNHLFTIIEHCLCHGLKSGHNYLAQDMKRSVNGGGGSSSSLGMALRWAGSTVFQEYDDGPDPFAVCQLVCKISPEALDLIKTITEMVNASGISSLGRSNASLLKTRIWLRLAFMQKRLGEYIRSIIDNRYRLKLDDLYHSEALVLQEEGAVVAGLLLALNVLDVTFVLKDISHLNYPMLNAIHYSNFMRKVYDGDVIETDKDASNDDGDEMNHLLDQKNYLEELNEHQRKTIESLQQRLQQAENSSQVCRKDLSQLQSESRMLKEENAILLAEKDSLVTEFERQKKRIELDIETEREAYNTSRIGLDQLNADLRRRLKEECDLRLEAERALENEVKRKLDGELTTSSMEQQLLEKMSVISSLRKQIDEVKSIHLETVSKLTETEESLGHKLLLVGRLEEKNTSMSEAIDKMRRDIARLEQEKRLLNENQQKLQTKISGLETKCAELESDKRIQAEIKSNMQHQCDNLKKEKESFRERIHQLESFAEESTRLRLQVTTLEKRCADQESALEEMAEHVTHAKLEAENLREKQAASHEAIWADDKVVTDCGQCRRPFSVARRKHHCRNCGGIFCNECSVNKMTLPSSAKPVRVCDHCHLNLMQRFIVR